MFAEDDALDSNNTVPTPPKKKKSTFFLVRCTRHLSVHWVHKKRKKGETVQNDEKSEQG